MLGTYLVQSPNVWHIFFVEQLACLTVALVLCSLKGEQQGT